MFSLETQSQTEFLLSFSKRPDNNPINLCDACVSSSSNQKAS